MEFNHIFIVNPVAGKGKGSEIIKIIDEYCKSIGIRYKIFCTSRPNEATEFVKGLGNGNVIYSVGGDGTLKEVVNGIVETDNILSVIPTGSGNDFNKSLEYLPKKISSIDLGKVNEQYFINIASIGLDAQIASNAELMKSKNIPNCMIYNTSILYSIFNRKDPEINLYGDRRKLTLMAICNGRYYGNGFQIAPYADLQDGFLDVYMVESLRTFEIPGLFLKLIRGTHEKSKYVRKFWCDGLDIESDYEILCNVDGEIIRGKKFKFRIYPSIVKVDNSDMIGIKQYIKKCKV